MSHDRRPTVLHARLFAVPRHAQRFRRPTDVILLSVSLVLLVVTAVRADQQSTGFEAALADLLGELPAVLTPVWQAALDVLQLWALATLVLAAVRRHWELARDLAIALGGVVVGSLVVGRVATGAWPDLVGGLAHHDPPLDFPALSLAASTALLGVAAPHLARPLRYFGRTLLVTGSIAAVALELVSPGDGLGALALGWAVASVVHLANGSPGGLPPLDDVRAALAGIGVEAEPCGMETDAGVVRVRAKREGGSAVAVKIYGQDAWDGQILVTLWRFLWYRDSGPTLTLTRLQQVEHEAFLTLLAERRGAKVAPVVTASVDSRGDALLVTEEVGTGLAETPEPPGDDELAAAWRSLDQLHRVGIRHGAIGPERVRTTGDGVYLADFARAEVGAPDHELLLDRAQMLVTTAVAAGPERAVKAALDVLGSSGLAAVTSYVQPAALPVTLRRQVGAAGLELDELRSAAVAATGGEEPELQRLRRLTAGRVVMGVLLFVAGFALISALTDVGLDTLVEALTGASLPLLLLAFVLGQTPRLSNAAALAAASPIRVPYGRLAALEFAICFVNLAMPSTAARVAVNIRFFQRSGLDRTGAVTIGAFDSVAGFVAQILLLVTIPLLGLGSLELDIDQTFSFDPNGQLFAAVVVLLLAGVAAVALVAKLRNAVVGIARRAWAAAGPLLRSPRRLVKVIGANLVSQLLFSLTMYTVLGAYDQSVSFADVVLVNELVALFSGLMPVPGGIGVTEAALTAGFVALGVDPATAFAAAIVYRLLTFYVPPVFGVLTFRWLERERYL